MFILIYLFALIFLLIYWQAEISCLICHHLKELMKTVSHEFLHVKSTDQFFVYLNNHLAASAVSKHTLFLRNYLVKFHRHFNWKLLWESVRCDWQTACRWHRRLGSFSYYSNNDFLYLSSLPTSLTAFLVLIIQDPIILPTHENTSYFIVEKCSSTVSRRFLSDFLLVPFVKNASYMHVSFICLSRTSCSLSPVKNPPSQLPLALLKSLFCALT